MKPTLRDGQELYDALKRRLAYINEFIRALRRGRFGAKDEQMIAFKHKRRELQQAMSRLERAMVRHPGFGDLINEDVYRECKQIFHLH